MYNSFNGFFEGFKLFLTGEQPLTAQVLDLFWLVLGIALILLGTANYPIFSKIMNIVAAIFGMWWSISVINVPNWQYSESDQTVIYIFTAVFFSLALAIFFSPIMWSDEKAETSYYLVLGTLMSETNYEGGWKALCIAAAVIITIGGFIGTKVASSIGFVASGIIGIILYIVIATLSVIGGIKYIDEELL